MIHLSEDQSRTLAGALPVDSVAFLRDTGVPELVTFRGIDHGFTLDMATVLDGRAFRVGMVDRGWYAMAVERGTGHFGYVFAEPGQPPWVFCNSSVAQFLACFAVFDRLGCMEAAGQIAWDARGEVLERELRGIDQAVFADENNIWSFLVEEVRAGVV